MSTLPAKTRRRPHTYSRELGAKVAEQIANAATLKEIAAKPGMPSKQAILNWMAREPEFRQMMLQAREISAFVYADRALEKAMALLDGAVSPADVKAAAEALKHIRWDASKRSPRSFGDQHQQRPTIALQINTNLPLGDAEGALRGGELQTFRYEARIPELEGED